MPKIEPPQKKALPKQKAQNKPLKKEVIESPCPTETALDLIGGKWKGMILYYLCSDTQRFSELMRLIPDITQRMLTKQLRDLEANGIVHREVYPQVPPKVEYSLTDMGKTLEPVIRGLEKWGKGYLKNKDS